MKTMIIYATKTGHSKKIASAIGEQLGISPQNISEKPIIENIDILFIGGGIYAGKSSPELIQFIETISKDNVKNVALFSTCTSGQTKLNDAKEMLIAKGITVIEDSFVCKGQFLLFSRKHPNDVDVQNAKNFATEIVAKFL